MHAPCSMHHHHRPSLVSPISLDSRSIVAVISCAKHRSNMLRIAVPAHIPTPERKNQSMQKRSHAKRPNPIFLSNGSVNGRSRATHVIRRMMRQIRSLHVPHHGGQVHAAFPPTARVFAAATCCVPGLLDVVVVVVVGAVVAHS